MVPQQTEQSPCWTGHLGGRDRAQWKIILRSVEIILPDEHKKLLTATFRSRIVQEARCKKNIFASLNAIPVSKVVSNEQ
jgi:hypothetical protein